MAPRELDVVQAFCCHEQRIALEFPAPPCRSCGRTPQYEPPLTWVD